MPEQVHLSVDLLTSLFGKKEVDTIIFLLHGEKKSTLIEESTKLERLSISC